MRNDVDANLIPDINNVLNNLISSAVVLPVCLETTEPMWESAPGCQTTLNFGIRL